ncbi:MAG: DUF3021 family protein [Clostridia bacterium]|nr:DUF3021 family protein [Clostridia bacterium]
MDWKRIGIHTSVYFTVMTAFVLLINCIYSSTGFYEVSFSNYRVLCFLPFSALFAFANVNFKYAKSSTAVRTLIHFVLTVGGFFVFFYLPYRTQDSSLEMAFAMAAIMILIYWIIMGIFLGLRARFLQIDRDSKQYKSLYRKKKGGSAKKDGDKPKTEKPKKNSDDYQSVYKKK